MDALGIRQVYEAEPTRLFHTLAAVLRNKHMFRPL